MALVIKKGDLGITTNMLPSSSNVLGDLGLQCEAGNGHPYLDVLQMFPEIWGFGDHGGLPYPF
jgi:hypothetical protein